MYSRKMSDAFGPTGLLNAIGRGPFEQRDFDVLEELVNNYNTGNAGAGWADYADTQYTTGAPFSVVADTDTILPNNGLSGPKLYEPADITAAGGYVQDGKIESFNGDSILITTNMKLRPTSANTEQFELWYDIGGSVGELYRRIVGFPKGNGVERPFTATTLVYTLDTWETNGATVYVRADGPVEIYDIRHVIARQFKAPTA